MIFDYNAYLDQFLSGDDEGLVERFFAKECAMHTASGVFRGHDGMRAFLAKAHDGVRECPRLQHYVQNENSLFAEIDMDFHASEYRPQFPFGSMSPGDSMTVKFLAHYELNSEGKIEKLTTMAWPPERGVTKLPKLGPHPSQIAAYYAYTAAFSLGDGERFKLFYTDDVVLELPAVDRIEGAQAISDFYQAMTQSVVETLTIHSLDVTDDSLVVDATSRFTAIAPADDFVVMPLAKGDYVDVRVIVTYSLEEGLIKHIKVKRDGEPALTRAAPQPL